MLSNRDINNQPLNKRNEYYRKESEEMTPKLLMNTKTQFKYDPNKIVQMSQFSGESLRTIEGDKLVPITIRTSQVVRNESNPYFNI
jgi:hypothetical protein